MTLFLLAVGAAVFLAAALSVLYGSMEITFGQVVNASSGRMLRISGIS